MNKMKKQIDRKTKSEKEHKQLQISNIVSILLSVIAMIISVYEHFEIIRYERMDTYETPLAYNIEISDKKNDGKIEFMGNTINTGSIYINIRTGGILNYNIIYCVNEKIDTMFSDSFTEKPELKYDSSELDFVIGEYTLEKEVEDDTYYYSSIFIVLEDYQHNYYTNMILYRLNKDDIQQIDTMVISEIDIIKYYDKGYTENEFFNNDKLKDFIYLRDILKASIQ